MIIKKERKKITKVNVKTIIATPIVIEVILGIKNHLKYTILIKIKGFYTFLFNINVPTLFLNKKLINKNKINNKV